MIVREQLTANVTMLSTHFTPSLSPPSEATISTNTHQTSTIRQETTNISNLYDSSLCAKRICMGEGEEPSLSSFEEAWSSAM